MSRRPSYFLIAASCLLHLQFGMVALGQTMEKKDSIPAATVWGEKGFQRAVSERFVIPKDFSFMTSVVGRGDVVKLVQTLPGIASGSDGSAAYYVRGGNMSGNLQTLDGVPVYGNSHLMGLTTAYSSDILESSSFHVGGFTSEEGNLSSSHIRLFSRDGSFDNVDAKAEISNLLIGGMLSAPVIRERLSVIASARYSLAPHLFGLVADRLDPEVIGVKNADAMIYDFYAKFKYRFDDGRSLSLSAFRSQDKYNFLMGGDSEDKMSWENTMAILRFESPWLDRGRLTASASVNHYANSRGMMKQMDKTSNNLLISSILDEAMLQAMIATSAGSRWAFQYGVKMRAAHFNPGAARELVSTGLYPKTSSPMASRSEMNYTGVLHGQAEYGSYEKGLLRLAGRLNCNSIAGFVPELSAMTRLPMSSFLGMEATGDWLAQFYHTLEGMPLGWSLDMIVPPSKALKPERTAQVYAGIYSDIGSHHFSAGAYCKSSSNLIWFADASKLFDVSVAGWEQNICVGTGFSKGVEFMYEKAGEKSNWRISYTLSKTDRVFPDVNGGAAFPAKFDRRHVLNATAMLRLLTHKRFQLSMSGLFTYQSGHWETVTAGSWHDNNFITGPVEIEFYSAVNNYRMPAYIRCDVGLLMEFTDRKHPSSLNVGVYNVLNRHNPFCLTYNPATHEWARISLLPVMPSLSWVIDLK